MKVEFLPIPTQGLPWYRAWMRVLFTSRRFKLLEDTLIYDQLIPKGFESNGLSIPKPFRIIIDPFGVALKAAIVHDYEIRTKQRVDQVGNLIQRNVSRKDADRNFRRLIRQLNGVKGYDTILYGAVRIGALFSKV